MKFLIIIGVSLFLFSCASQLEAPPAPVIEATPKPKPEPKPKPAPKKVIEQPEVSVKRPDFHVVKPGDTLTSIALDYGLSYRNLTFWNNIKNPDLIRVDQQLRLSQPTNAPTTTVVTKQKPTVLVPNNPVLTPVETVTPALLATVVLPNPIAPTLPVSTTVTKPKTTLINTNTTDNSQPVSLAINENAAIKVFPQASKYLYSKSTLKQLKQQWVKSNSSIVANQPKTTIKSSAIAPTKHRQRFNVTWSWPSSNTVSKAFGSANKGLTFAGALGEPVYSVADGKVIYVGTGVKAYGRLIIIKHNNDYLSAYAHNDKILVKESDAVKRGSPIATFGSTGTDTVKLVLEIRKTGKPINPIQVLPATP